MDPGIARSPPSQQRSQQQQQQHQSGQQQQQQQQAQQSNKGLFSQRSTGSLFGGASSPPGGAGAAAAAGGAAGGGGGGRQRDDYGAGPLDAPAQQPIINPFARSRLQQTAPGQQGQQGPGVGGGAGGGAGAGGAPMMMSMPTQRPFQTGPAEEVMSPDWTRKESRQRRFTEHTLPGLHARREAVREMRDFDDEERDNAFVDMNSHLEDMSVNIKMFADAKDAERAMMFDENGDPLPDGFDEDDRPEPSPRGPKKGLNVVIKFENIPMLEGGYLWKKGSGLSILGRRNWAKRFFKPNRLNPLQIMYFTQEQKRLIPIQPGEDPKRYKIRERIHCEQEQQAARGVLSLIDATLRFPEIPLIHKNKNVQSEFEFEIETIYDLVDGRPVQGGRQYRLFAPDKESFDKWIATFKYLIDAVALAKADVNKKKTRRTPLIEEELVSDDKRDEAQTCSAFGSGLFEAIAGQTAEFTIQGAPALGIPDPFGANTFNVVLESEDLHYDLTANDNGDGTYTVHYVPTRIGVYELSILYQNCDIQGSPFHPVVHPAPVSAPHCIAEGAGLYCAVVGEVNQFTIQTRNIFNELVPTRGVKFDFQFGHPLRLLDNDPIDTDQPSGIVDNEDGTYTISYVVEPTEEETKKLEIGETVDATITIQLDDGLHTPSFPRNIRGSPFHPVLAASATEEALAQAAKRAFSRPYARSLYHQSSTQNLLGGFNNNEIPFRSQRQQQQQQQQPQQQQQQRFQEEEEEKHDPLLSNVDAAPHPRKDVTFFDSPPPKRAPPTSGSRTKRKNKREKGRSLDDSSMSSPSRGGGPNYSSFLPIHTAEEPFPVAGAPSSIASPDGKSSDKRSRPVSVGRGGSARDRFVSKLQQQHEALTESSALSFDEEVSQNEREQLLQLRRELAESRSLVDQQVNRVSVMGRRVQADADWLLSQVHDAPDPTQPKPLRYVPSTVTQQQQPNNDFIPIIPPSTLQGSNGLDRSFRKENINLPPPPQTPPPSRQAQKFEPLTSKAFDASVMALFNKHQAVLREVYEFYASTGAVRMPGFVRLAQDYDITPTFISRKELRECFDSACQGSDSLSFPRFVESLGYIATTSLSKPTFAHLYTTTQAKVNVLLVMWGVGDPNLLAATKTRSSMA